MLGELKINITNQLLSEQVPSVGPGGGEGGEWEGRAGGGGGDGRGGEGDERGGRGDYTVSDRQGMGARRPGLGGGS